MAESDKQTPLMRQYNRIKEKYPDTILLFRLGDFYETFEDDAVKTAEACGIALTKRNNGSAGQSHLAGFPWHQLDTYLPKLVKAGYRVAVCEQLEDPKMAKGIVKRGVVEVVTPGVALYDKLLDTKKNKFLACALLKKDKGMNWWAAVAICDISTGEFSTCEIPAGKLIEVIESYNPSEIIINKSQKDDISPELEGLSSEAQITKLEDWIFDKEFCNDLLHKHFKTKTLKGFGIESFDLGISAAGAILHYINETQKTELEHIQTISVLDPSEYMTLDWPTRRNLEITFSVNDNRKDGSLFSVLDKTLTPMGGRLLKKWVNMPLKVLDKINQRLDAVEELIDQTDKRAFLRETLKGVSDFERLISKVCTSRANPIDLISIRNSLSLIPDILSAVSDLKSDLIVQIRNELNPLNELINYINQALKDEPSTNVGNGNVFSKGWSEELDSYIEAKTSGKDWIIEYKEKERLRTDISSLKVSFNNVFRYYIEVTKVHAAKVPADYERKQTLTNSERYTTPELKQIESKILTAQEHINELEQKLFAELLTHISGYTSQIQKNAKLIAIIDCLLCFAQVSTANNYVKPLINDGESLKIIDGRHPVVEKLIPVGESFTPNSTILDPGKEQVHIITGPNMSGKSCYLRQVAHIVLMGQIGCFVPAVSAKFGIVDRIFTRVGAQDNITAGESTFLVEMQEAANIINNATRKSLILLDEVGRGTATFDGLSIAWSITEYIHNRVGAKTLFATHYHELNELAERYDRIVNYRVEVIEAGGTVIFSHKVKKGGSDHSFGIHVASMAGLPREIIERAGEIMALLESETVNNKGSFSNSLINTSLINTKGNENDDQLAIFEFRDDELREKIINLKVENLTPLQAIKVLANLQKEAKRNMRK